MKRFDKINDDKINYSDRFGFKSVSQESSSGKEKKKSYKIHISSDGKATESPLKYSLADELIDILKSPWLDNYRDLTRSLISAIRKEPFIDESIDRINKISFTPFFIGCPPRNESSCRFENQNLNIKILISDEEKNLDSQIIQVFGERFYELPPIPITLSIVSDSSVLGYLHGQIYNRDQRSFIEVLRLESNKGESLTWKDIPDQVYLLGRIDLSGAENNTKLEKLPSVIEESPIIKVSKQDNIYEYTVNILTVPVKNLNIDLINIDREILIQVRDIKQNILCYLSGHLRKDGEIELGDLIPLRDDQKIEWSEIPAKTLYFAIEIEDSISSID